MKWKSRLLIFKEQQPTGKLPHTTDQWCDYMESLGQSFVFVMLARFAALQPKNWRVRWVRAKSEVASESRRSRESDCAHRGADVACDGVWPHLEAVTHTMSLPPAGLGTVLCSTSSVSRLKTEGPSTVTHHRHPERTQMPFVTANICVTVKDECLHLCCFSHLLANSVSILVSFCLWFDIVSVGVTLVAVLFHECRINIGSR